MTTRRCSHCSGNGHMARSCPVRTGGGGGVRLFGVRLTGGSLVKKSASMGNLPSHYYSAAAAAGAYYHSDDPDHGSAAHDRFRKKGMPWTEEEHRTFLLGLQMLGRGNWRGISRNYVVSRSPSQVASHAQKYFIHQSSTARKKKRTSVFDTVRNVDTNLLMPAVGADNKEITPCSSQEANMDSSLHSLDLSLKPAFVPFPFRLWPPNAYLPDENASGTSHQQILQPAPAVPKEPTREMLGVPQLTLGETCTVQFEPSLLSLSLPGMP